jgi:hypothetical protein
VHSKFRVDSKWARNNIPLLHREDIISDDKFKQARFSKYYTDLCNLADCYIPSVCYSDLHFGSDISGKNKAIRRGFKTFTQILSSSSSSYVAEVAEVVSELGKV